MPFKNPQDAHQYKLRWTAERRATWFAGKRCVRCGSTESLQLDHVDPLRKVDHRIWNWATERREVELAKCQPLCEECHKDKTRSEQRARVAHGTNTMYNMGCRCDECRLAKSRTNRKRYKLPPS